MVKLTIWRVIVAHAILAIVAFCGHEDVGFFALIVE